MELVSQPPGFTHTHSNSILLTHSLTQGLLHPSFAHSYAHFLLLTHAVCAGCHSSIDIFCQLCQLPLSLSLAVSCLSRLYFHWISQAHWNFPVGVHSNIPNFVALLMCSHLEHFWDQISQISWLNIFTD